MPEKLYIVRRGQRLSRIAAQFNIADPETVYNHETNEHLRNKRPERDLICEDDEIWVPVQDELEAPTKGKNGSSVDISVTPPPPEQLTVILKNENDEPLAGLEYRITYSGQSEDIEGTTDSEGRLEAEVPFGVEFMRVELEDKVLELGVGHLDPPDTIQGVSNRLRNLAYYSGDVTKQVTPQLYEALSKFQEDNELSISGKPDQTTVDRLTDLHGC